MHFDNLFRLFFGPSFPSRGYCNFLNSITYALLKLNDVLDLF
jgi:hypothetical protein